MSSRFVFSVCVYFVTQSDVLVFPPTKDQAEQSGLRVEELRVHVRGRLHLSLIHISEPTRR